MKLIGSGIIFLAFLSTGILCVSDKKRHIQFLSVMIEALRLLSVEMQNSRPPMEELLGWTARHTEGETAAFFFNLANTFTKLGEESFEMLWRKSTENSLRSMRAADYRDLCTLGKMLGRAELGKQISALESCCRSFHARLEREELRFQEDKKLCLGVPAALGLLVCILLL